MSAEQLLAWVSSCNCGGFVVGALLDVGGKTRGVVRDMLSRAPSRDTRLYGKCSANRNVVDLIIHLFIFCSKYSSTREI